VGYDLHISRALSWFDSEHYPIRPQEVIDLVRRSPDLAMRGTGDDEFAIDCDDWSLRYRDGELTAGNPPDGAVRRMLGLAADLDAWVTGDDGEVYEWDGVRMRTRERPDEEQPVDPLYLSRDGAIAAEEWMAVAAGQPDFRVDTTIEARLPSGVAWIPCPPVARWTGHPSGDPVWCFHDEDLVEVRCDDAATVRRMTELAARLGAEVLRWDGEPVRPAS
jgi:hypothetical protein